LVLTYFRLVNGCLSTLLFFFDKDENPIPFLTSEVLNIALQPSLT